MKRPADHVPPIIIAGLFVFAVFLESMLDQPAQILEKPNDADAQVGRLMTLVMLTYEGSALESALRDRMGITKEALAVAFPLVQFVSVSTHQADREIKGMLSVANDDVDRTVEAEALISASGPPVVILYPPFWKLTSLQQQNLLIHELLHWLCNCDDETLFRAFASMGFSRNRLDATVEISNWIGQLRLMRNGCFLGSCKQALSRAGC